MNVEYSKDFEKSVKKLSGKMLDSIRRVIAEVKNAESIKEITDCKKLVGYRNVYRIRIGDYRAFFTSVITLRMESSILPESFLTDFSKSLEYSTFIRQASFQNQFFPAGSK